MDLGVGSIAVVVDDGIRNSLPRRLIVFCLPVVAAAEKLGCVEVCNGFGMRWSD
jgi:hypothetical protein